MSTRTQRCQRAAAPLCWAVRQLWFFHATRAGGRFPSAAVGDVWVGECHYVHPLDMKVLKRSNRFYDTERFGQPQIRLRHRKSRGLKSPSYVLRCGCCEHKLEIFYSEDGMEVGGVNGALEDWREILLPLLLIERRGGELVDVARRAKKSARTVQRTGKPIRLWKARASSSVGSRRRPLR